MVDLYHFMGLIFMDEHSHAHYVLYNRAYFTGLIFAVRQSSAKVAKIGPLKNFLLYSNHRLASLLGHLQNQYGSYDPGINIIY